jgi:molybdopterin/thiamine biosynthesis adenylyltransferase
MSTARQENARTLAAAIGSSEEEAEALLNATAVITCAPGSERLAGYIESLLARTLSRVQREFDGVPSVEVVVGSVAPRSNARTIFVGVDGYRLEVHEGSPVQHDAQARPIVDLVAACYAAAAAVHHALRVELAVPLRMPIMVDLAQLYGAAITRLDARIELGVCFMAGAGAIGNAVIAGLSMLDVQGNLHICDPDDASDGNLNRCWWFGPEDLNEPKAERLVLRAQPSMPQLTMIPHVGTLHDAIEKLSESKVETLIVGVDSRRARRSLQNEMPHRVFDASTSGITEFVLHFNESPSESACMSCIYYEAPDESAHEAHVAEKLGVTIADVRTNFVSPVAAVAIARLYPQLDPAKLQGLAYDSLFKELCGKGELTTGTAERVLAPFGFVSVLAGAMLAIEIAIRTGSDNAQPSYNYWRLSPWGAPVDRMRQMRQKRAACEFCGNKTLQSVVEELWG